MGGHHRIAASSLSASALPVACNAMLDIEGGSLGENGGTSGAAGVAAQAGFDWEAGRYGSGGTTQSVTYGGGVAGDSSQGGSTSTAGRGGESGGTLGLVAGADGAGTESAGQPEGGEDGWSGSGGSAVSAGAAGALIVPSAGNAGTGGSGQPLGGNAGTGGVSPPEGGSSGGGALPGSGGDAGIGGALVPQAGSSGSAGDTQQVSGGSGGIGGFAGGTEFGGAAGHGGATESGGTAGSAGAPDSCQGVDFSSDELNCGWCGHDCIETTCSSATCGVTTVDTGAMNGHGDVLIAGPLLFWSGADLRWSGRENPFQNLGYDDLMWVPSELALWDDTCYVACKTNSDPIFGWRSASGNGELTTISRNARGGFVVDSTGVYWGSCTGSVGTISFAPHSALEAEEIIATNLPCSATMRIDGDYLWFTSGDDPGVYRLNKNDRALDAPAAFRNIGLRGTQALLIDGDYVYVGTYDRVEDYEDPGDGIYRLPKDGSGPTEIIVDASTHPQWAPWEFAIDGGYLYWTNLGQYTDDRDFENGSVNRVAIDPPDGEVVPLAEGQRVATGLAIDDPWVYWVAYPVQDSGVLRRIAK